jgi:hypothetical protein
MLRLVRLLRMRLLMMGHFPFMAVPLLVMLYMRGLLMHMLRAALAALVRMRRSGVSVVLLMTVVVFFLMFAVVVFVRTGLPIVIMVVPVLSQCGRLCQKKA